jgi:hypothetical protein
MESHAGLLSSNPSVKKQPEQVAKLLTKPLVSDPYVRLKHNNKRKGNPTQWQEAEKQLA